MLCSFLAIVAVAPVTLSLTPTDDIWVYPHASDPQKDVYLRVWGTDGAAVAEDPADSDNFSYSILQWDVSGAPAGTKLVSAKLLLTNVADPKYTAEQAKKWPLQARPMPSGFSEKTWKYELLLQFYPGKKTQDVFGTGFPDPFPKTGTEFHLTIDLLKGPNDFGKYFAAAVEAKKPLAIALTTALEVTVNEDVQTLYKFYSKDTPTESQRPKLELKFE